MPATPRLKWIREKDRFAAYPVGHDKPRRGAFIWPNTARTGSWAWTAMWDGWFAESGIGETKQEAADAATGAWWRLVATPIPRDVEGEIAVLIARAPVMPLPGLDAETLADTAMGALAQTGKRGLLAIGGGVLEVRTIPAHVHVIDAAPMGHCSGMSAPPSTTVERVRPPPRSEGACP